MKVAIYARVSTKDQSNEIQIQELRKFAERNNHEIIDFYVDTVTGNVDKRKRRTRYDDLFSDAELKKFDCVLVWKLDRFARSTKHLISASENLQRLGIDFISHTESIDTTTASGKLFFHMLAAFAEFEHSLISERTMRGIRLVMETGRNSKGELSRMGRPEGINAEQKDRIIYEFVQHGKTLAQIADVEKMPLQSINSIVRRSVCRIQCRHGKYRCNPCGRVARRVQVRAIAAEAKRALG